MSGKDRTPSQRMPWLVVVAVLVVALTLRGPIVAVTPVLAEIQKDLRLSESAVGLLVTAPVLVFAVISPVAVLIIRRAGAELSVALTLLGVLAGELLRAVPNTVGMVAGTLVIGISIAVGNVVLPVVIQRDVPPARASLVTGAYTATLNIGSVLTTLGTAPLATVLGWPLAVATWSVFTLAGLALWGVHLRHRPGRGDRPGPAGSQQTQPRSSFGFPSGGEAIGSGRQVPGREGRPAWRIPLTWLLSLAFSAQAFSFYAYTTWLPTYLSDTQGASASGAGALASVFQGWGIAGALAVPLIARVGGHRAAAAMVSACWIAMSAGVLFAPDQLAVWLSFGGLAHGGGFVVIFTAVIVGTRGAREAAGMSAFVQAFGYAVAALSGPAIGALQSVTGGWSIPLGVLMAVTVLFAVFTLAATAFAHRRDHSDQT